MRVDKNTYFCDLSILLLFKEHYCTLAINSYSFLGKDFFLVNEIASCYCFTEFTEDWQSNEAVTVDLRPLK